MTQYEFYESDIVLLTNDNGEERVIDLNDWEMFDPKTEEGKENIKYLFEGKGMGERNPFATAEELENYNH